MDTNQEEFNGLDDLNVQNVNEEEVTLPKTRSFLKGATLAKGSNDGQESGTEGTDGETVQTRGANDDPEPAPAEHDPPVPTRSSNGPVSIISDKLGQDHPIHAKQLEDTHTVTLTGDVKGTGHWNFRANETMDVQLESDVVTNRELAANSVVGAAGGSSGSSQKSNIVQGSIGLADINSGAIDTTVAAGSSNLVTSGAVQTAINNAVSGRGTTYGPMTVTEINALQNVNDGSTVHVSGQGTGKSWVINDGISDTGVAGAITVRDKSDLRYMNNDTKHGWYSLDAEFKLRQNEVLDPQVPSTGTTESISFIDSIRQNENGEITPSKKNVRQASTSQTGVVQLTNATDSNSETLAATAKAVKTVKDATDLLSSGKKDKQTPITGNQGSTAKTLTSIAQNADGVITPTFENIQSANASQPGLMSAADYSKLDALPTNTVLENKLAGKKDDQTPVDTDSATGAGKGGSLRTLTRLQQNANGEITATFADIPEAVATVVGETDGSKGLMSAEDKTKLDAVKPGATKVEASETNGNIKIDGVEANVYTHPSAGATSHGSKGDTQNQTPGFGETFKSISATVDTDGHTTALGEHTVTIPSATAEAPDATHEDGIDGLMSGVDKGKLDNIAEGAEVNQNAYSIVKVGTTNVSATSKTDTLTLVGGNGITLTPNASTKTVTIDSDALPSDTVSAVATTASVGSSTEYSRADHVHNIALGEGTATGTVSIAGQNVAVKDFGTKADKVSGATENNFAAFDANGNIKDSGKNASNFKTVQTAKASPEASGTDISFIDTITQNTNGEITATRKTVRGATTAQTGVVQLAGSIGATVDTENNKAASEKAVRDAIDALDVTSVGGEGKYITSISETDGKIAPVAETADTEPTLNSKKMITSGGVKAAINALDYTDTKNDHEFVTLVNEADGVVSVTHAQPAVADISGLQTALDGKQDNLAFDGTYDATDNKVATVSTVTGAIAGLDATKTSTDGKNVQVKVTETDGKITAVNITTDNTENKNNKKTTLNSTSDTEYPTSKAVATYVGQQIATQSATFRGTLSLADLGLTYGATNAEIAAKLNTHTWPTGVTITNNDTVNVTVNNPATTDIDTYKRFKYSSSETTWKWEYDINNTTFSTDQMAAINSGITTAKRENYDAHLLDTSNPHQVTAAQVGLGNVLNTGDSATPVSGGTTKFTTGGAYTELAKKADKTTTVTNVAWDATNKKLTKTINGTTTDVVSASTLKTAMDLNKVENKSAADLKAEFKGTITNGDQGFVIGDDVYDKLALKQNELTTYTPYTEKGSATTVPQITTNSLGQVTGITEVTISGVTPAAHTHGNITNGGEINATSQSADTAIQSGDKIVVTDSSTGSKVSRSTITFDGSTENQALTPKGTWKTFLQEHQDISGKANWSGTVNKVQLDTTNQKLQYVTGNPGGTQTTTDIANLDGTYNASSNPIATKSTVTSAIADLDSTKSGSGNHVTVEVVETDGKLTSVTVTDSAAAGDHVHGDITNDGKITASAVSVANGDSLVITDSSASGKVVKSNISFDGTTTNKALTQAGTWAEFNNNKAFANVKVGDTTVAADASEDTLELVAGSGITLTPDAANDKVTVAHTNSVTAGTIGSSEASSGVTLQVPYASYDANGHITGKGTHTHTVPAATTAASGVTTLQDTIGATELTSNKAATPKAVRDAINALDVTEVGGVTTDQSGNVTKVEYISKIKEENGIITATTATMDTTPTENSTNAVTSGGIWSELDKKVNVDDMVAVTGRGTYDGTTHRLTFNDIIFDNIYPVVGKYGLSVFSENTAVNAAESSGDKEWLLDWRPYLIDMSAVQGETAKTPVAELKPGNWLRKTDGSYATVCGITSTQAAALDNKSDTLKFGTGTGSSSTVAALVEGVYTGNTFNPAVLWEYLNTAAGLAAVNSAAGKSYTCAIEVEVTDGTNTYKYGSHTNDHIPAPWETTETKYSVFIGRTSDVYVIDGVYSGTSTDTTNNSLYMRGLAAKPVPVGVDGFDPEDYRLRRTGISPGPSTTYDGKIRNFFYNYASSLMPKGNSSAAASCFYNNGAYPRTNDASQYNTVKWCRACNSGGSNGNAIPVAEGGYHSLNAFLCSIEAAYKARDVFAAATKFSSGVSSNDTTRNGVWTGSAYGAWNNGTYGSNNANGFYPKFQCLEPQIAASLAAEMGLAANAEFQWNGGTWHYEVPTIDGIKTLADNKMNCRIYKKITKGLSAAAITAGGANAHYMLRCALAEGVNPVGDIWWYQGGGCEIVYETTGTGATDYKYSFYLEPDQSKWISGTYVTSATEANEKHTDNAKFTAETQYKAIITDSTIGGTSNAYCLSRTGYSPLRKVSGGGTTTGECCYQYRQIDENAKGQAGIRSRRRVVFRGNANRDNCSPRYLSSDSRPSSAHAYIGCAAQVLLA